MSRTYTLPLTPGQMRIYIEQGLDLVSGLAVDSEAIESLTEVSDLIDLFQIGFDGGPFTGDEPLYVLDLEAGPLVHARKAVGPLEKGAFLGGMFEVMPFNGSGIATAKDVTTELLWIEPARITAGSQIWKFTPGKDEPELVAAYHGIAYGWETENGFKAVVPSTFIGTVIKRSWGEIPCDVEVEDGTPVSVTLVAPAEPEKEEGFTQIESGLWAKRIEYNDDMQIYEAQKIAKIDGVPSRVLRPLKRDDKLLLEVQSLLPDAVYTRSRGFTRFAPTVFVKAVPLEGVKAQSRTATPRKWDVQNITPAVSSDMEGRELTDTQKLLPEVFRLITNAVPDNFQKIDLVLQLIGKHVVFHCEATLNDGSKENIQSLPTALIHYARQLKMNTADPEEGAFFLARFAFESSGTANFGFNKTDQPAWASQVPASEWKADIEEFPRSGANTPDWLIDAISGKLQSAQKENS